MPDNARDSTYRTILVPLDGSSLAERALPLAEAVAARAGSQLILLRVALAQSTLGDDPGEAKRVAISAVEAYLSRVSRHIDEALRSEPAVYYASSAAAAVLEELERRPVDLVVMGTHGRSNVERWLHGSVADQVLRRSTVPVLLVPATCTRFWDRSQPMRIVVPLDGSDLALEGLAAARKLARLTRAEIALVRVIDPSRTNMYAEPIRQMRFSPEEQLADARRYLASIAGTLAASAPNVRVNAAIGDPADKIAAMAREQDADIVVMATHGRGGLSRLLAGSVATDMLHTSTVPLLLVRPTGVHVHAHDRNEADTVTAWEHAPTRIPAMAV